MMDINKEDNLKKVMKDRGYHLISTITSTQHSTIYNFYEWDFANMMAVKDGITCECTEDKEFELGYVTPFMHVLCSGKMGSLLLESHFRDRETAFKSEVVKLRI